MYFTLISILCLSEITFAKSLDDWILFKNYYNKKYDDQEDAVRYRIWKNNLELIEQHNQEYTSGLCSFSLKINSFADMTNDEFQQLMKVKAFHPNVFKNFSNNFNRLPDSIDYRDKGVVTPVKNQGILGNPGVFAATGALESHTALLTGHLFSLSEANIVNCCARCMSPEDGFQYVKTNNGIDAEECFPCSSEGCGFCKECVKATCSGYHQVTSGNEEELKKVLATIGPTAVLIDASNLSFQLYAGGVYDEPRCSSSLLDHAVLIVGYGSENGLDYWIVKNSWGTDWGLKGYIKMSRNKNNQCGIATDATYPLVP